MSFLLLLSWLSILPVIWTVTFHRDDLLKWHYTYVYLGGGDAIFIQMQDEFFSLNLVLKYVTLSQIDVWSAQLDGSEPDHVESNHGLHSQIITCKEKGEHSINKDDTIFFFGHCPLFGKLY
jgi:hypothetical protein